MLSHTGICVPYEYTHICVPYEYTHMGRPIRVWANGAEQINQSINEKGKAVCLV